MTAEKKYTDDFESSYQGKTWGIGKIIGIFAVVFACLVVRDLGMTFIYGSIYDKFAEEGVKASVSIMNYVYMILLYLLPMVLPMILRFTCGAYDNEIEESLFPSFNNKALNIIMYVVAGIFCVVPVVLFAVGMFTAAYMFVTVNLALLIFSSVVIFYYLGTYILQRARVSITKKQILPTVIMVATYIPTMLATAGIVLALNKFGKAPVITYLTQFAESWNKTELIAKGAGMFAIIALAIIVAGALYVLTQNIIYSAVPAVLFANANIVLLQRLKEISAYYAEVDRYTLLINDKTLSPAKIKTYKATLDELLLTWNEEVAAETLCYVFMGIMVVALLALLARAVIGIVKTHNGKN